MSPELDKKLVETYDKLFVNRNRPMTETAICELNAIRLPVNNELGDQIVTAWLKLHMEWAQDAFDSATNREDRDDAELDLIAIRRVLKYAGGEIYD